MALSGSNRDFSYYMHDGQNAFSFEVAGTITDSAADEMEQAWKTASSTANVDSLVVDLSYVTDVSAAGRKMLRRWYDAGAQLVAKRPSGRSIVASITGLPFGVVAEAAPYHTWRPVHVFLMVALMLLCAPASMIGTQF
jgi:hypothetical protein